MKPKGMFIHTHSSLRSVGYGISVISKDGKKNDFGYQDYCGRIRY